MDRMHMRYRKPSEQIVRDLIFFNTGYVLPAEAKFGVVTALDIDPADTWGIDTKVEVFIPREVISTSKGHRPIYYRRLDLGMLKEQSNATITSHAFPFSTHDILPQINLLFNIALSTDDVQDVLYNDLSVPFKLIAAPGSLAWKNFRVLEVNLPNLPSLIQVTDLNGFLPATVDD